MKTFLIVALAFGSLGCQSNIPNYVLTQPTAPSSSPSAFDVHGRLTATNGGFALPGVTVSIGTASVVTAADGTFQLTGTAAAPWRVLASGGGLVPRGVTSQNRTVDIDALIDGQAFDLAYYRKIGRDGYERPMALQPLRRWTQNPSIYVRTVSEGGLAIPDAIIGLTEAAIREAVPMWTAGQLQVATMLHGTGTRRSTPGFLTIKWYSASNHCGETAVGFEGEISIYQSAACGCNGLDVSAAVIQHEIGHALGLWHTGDPADLMSGFSLQCGQQPSGRELAHAAIIYHRPNGNMDPDIDP